MIAVIWCCHVRREVQVCYVMLRNVLSWLHECCTGFVLGRKPSMKPCILLCRVAAAGDERYLVCAAVAAAVVPSVMGSSSVFCNEWLSLCA